MNDLAAAQGVNDLVKVSVRLPSDEFINLEVPPDSTISDLLTSLVAHQIGLKERHITLLYRNEPMDPSHTLSVYNVDNSSSSGRGVSVEALVSGRDEADLKYDDFIEHMELSTQSQSMSDVSVEAYFTLR